MTRSSFRSSPESDVTLIEMWRTHDVPSIAAHLGCSETWVYTRARALVKVGTDLPAHLKGRPRPMRRVVGRARPPKSGEPWPDGWSIRTPSVDQLMGKR
jgi:hypothetical protein